METYANTVATEPLTLENIQDGMQLLRNITRPKAKSKIPILHANPYLTEHVLYARSPARAERRAKKGYRQNYITRPRRELLSIDGVNYYGHPDILDAITREIMAANSEEVK